MAGHNPFLPQKPAAEVGTFWGRQRELRLLASHLLDSEQPQSCAVIGPPLIGKTSLLLHLLARHQALPGKPGDHSAAHVGHLARTVECVLPMSDLTTARAERFYQRLYQGMRQRLLTLASQGQPRLALPTAAGGDSAALDRFLGVLAEASAAGYRFHFFLDDFAAISQNPTAFDANFFIQLRACAQLYSVAWVVASERPLLDLWDTTRAPFFGLLRPVSLGLLRPEEADELLDETARHGGHLFTPEERRALARLAGPHPAFLQVAGWHFYESRFARRLPSRAALPDAAYRYTAAARASYTALWERLTTEERQGLLTTLAQPAGDAPTPDRRDAGGTVPAPAGEPPALHDSTTQAPSAETQELLKRLAQRDALLRPADEGADVLPFGEGFAAFLSDLPPDRERTDEDEYQELTRLVGQLEASRDEREHVETALAQFRMGKYEAGLRALFPSLEKLTGALIQQRTRRLPPQQLGSRLEELHHLGIISQETLDLGMQLIPVRNNAAHGRAIAHAQQIARSVVILGRRLLQEAQKPGE